MFQPFTLFQQVALAVIGLINLGTFILYYVDKQRAIRRQYRIPERTLLLASFSLGGVGAWLGMSTFRHKTKHWKFKLSVPVAALITLAALYLVLARPI